MSRRDEILTAAAELFRERGFHGVGVDLIGKRVGVTGPAIYTHFSGKDEILAALFDVAMDGVEMDGEVSAEPRAELEARIAHHARFVVERRDLLAVWAQEHRSLVEPYRGRFTRRMRRFAATWEAAIAACHPDADPIDVATAAQAALGLMNSVARWPPSLLRGDEVADRLARHALGAVDALGPPR